VRLERHSEYWLVLVRIDFPKTFNGERDETLMGKYYRILVKECYKTLMLYKIDEDTTSTWQCILDENQEDEDDRVFNDV